MQYRLLKKGEMIQEGDIVFLVKLETWNTVSEVVLGRPWEELMGPYARPIKDKTEWLPIADKVPETWPVELLELKPGGANVQSADNESEWHRLKQGRTHYRPLDLPVVKEEWEVACDITTLDGSPFSNVERMRELNKLVYACLKFVEKHTAALNKTKEEGK